MGWFLGQILPPFLPKNPSPLLLKVNQEEQTVGQSGIRRTWVDFGDASGSSFPEKEKKGSRKNT